jgi:hypothetical protein
MHPGLLDRHDAIFVDAQGGLHPCVILSLHPAQPSRRNDATLQIWGRSCLTLRAVRHSRRGERDTWRLRRHCEQRIAGAQALPE